MHRLVVLHRELYPYSGNHRRWKVVPTIRTFRQRISDG